MSKAQSNFIDHGMPWDMMSNIRAIVGNPAAQAEAEAMYAPFFALLQGITPESLEVALASIRRRIAEYEKNIPPEGT